MNWSKFLKYLPTTYSNNSNLLYSSKVIKYYSCSGATFYRFYSSGVTVIYSLTKAEKLKSIKLIVKSQG